MIIAILLVTSNILRFSSPQSTTQYDCKSGLENGNMIEALAQDVCEAKHLRITKKNNCYQQTFNQGPISEVADNHLHTICFQRDKINAWLSCFERTTCEVNGPCTSEYSQCLDRTRQTLNGMRDSPAKLIQPGKGKTGVEAVSQSNPRSSAQPGSTTKLFGPSTSAGLVWNLFVTPVVLNILQIAIYLLLLYCYN